MVSMVEWCWEEWCRPDDFGPGGATTSSVVRDVFRVHICVCVCLGFFG